MIIAKFWVAVAGFILCSPLAAALQDTWENDGTWSARIDGDAKTARQGRVVIDSFAGTWRELGAPRKGDPCRGAKPFPMTVQKSNPREVEFTVWATSVVASCPDFALTLRVVDERTLQGTLRLVDQHKIGGASPDGSGALLTRVPDKRPTKR